MHDASPPLELDVTIAAPAATVFRFLSDPARFQAWLGDGAELDPRPGGAVVIRYPDGQTARGAVQELVPEERLVFSWGYEGNPELPPGSSTVTILLVAVPDGTRVVLRHSGLPSVAAREGHGAGWRYYLSRLHTIGAAELAGPRARAAVDSYLAAWREADSARRDALLEACWEAQAFFADAMGSAEGCAGLSAYIAGALQHLPGVRVELDGSVDVVIDRVRFRWRGVMPDGAVMGRGTNYGELTPAGRFARMTGFWEGEEGEQGEKGATSPPAC